MKKKGSTHHWTNSIDMKLKKIKLLILDVDGVMTDGRIFWLEGQGWTRYFHVQDGYGLKLLMRFGIKIVIMSGGDSKDVRKRMEFLGITDVFLGSEDKLKLLRDIVVKFGVSFDEIAFMGDELFDIPVMECVGLSITVPNAIQGVKDKANWITQAAGGYGAVREVVDAIQRSQSLGDSATDSLI